MAFSCSTSKWGKRQHRDVGLLYQFKYITYSKKVLYFEYRKISESQKVHFINAFNSAMVQSKFFG